MEQSRSMAVHFIEKCEHGMVVTQCRCPDPNKTVRIVPCPYPEDCAMKAQAEEVQSDLPFENAHLGRMREENRQEAEGRFRGHDPYRGM